MNYSIIKNPKELNKFIEWLPELNPGETYYFCLFARSKYCKNIGLKSSQQLVRFTAPKKNLFSRIKQLECEVGSYLQSDISIPQEALALYMLPNPRSFEKAAKKGLITLATLITEPYFGYDPRSKMMSEIQRAWSRKPFLDIDFDNETDWDSPEYAESKREEILEFINLEAITQIITKGGFHLLVEMSKIEPKYIKTWYKNITSLQGVDIQGDNMIPIPGCTQGNFSPILVKQ